MRKETENIIDIDVEVLNLTESDILILNVNSDDVDVIFSEDLLGTVDKLGDTISDLLGFRIPVLMFGSDLFIEKLTQNELKFLIEQLQDLLVDENDESTDNFDITGAYQ